MDELFLFLSKNKDMFLYLEKEYAQLMTAIDEYYRGNSENVISIGAPVCESILRKVCKREQINCGTYMFDMLKSMSNLAINFPKVLIGYLHLIRILMNLKRHANDEYSISILDAYTTIIGVYYLMVWYLEHYGYSHSCTFESKKQGRDLFEERENILLSLLNNAEYPMCREVLTVIYERDVSVDSLIQQTNSSRMIILKSVLALIENCFVQWKNSEKDVLKINDSIYNNYYLIGKVLKDNE